MNLKGFWDREVAQPFAEGKASVSNQQIVDAVVESFRGSLERYSVDGQLIYDQNFLICLPSLADEEQAKMSLAQLALPIVKRCYSILRNRVYNSWLSPLVGKVYAKLGKEYDAGIAYQPYSRKGWTFKVCYDEQVELGRIEVYSYRTSDITWVDIFQDQKTRRGVSITRPNISYQQLEDINLDILRHVDLGEEGSVRVPWHDNLELPKESKAEALSGVRGNTPRTGGRTPETNIQAATTESYALIEYNGGMGSKSYQMNKESLLVGRAKEGEKPTPERLAITCGDTALLERHLSLSYRADRNSLTLTLYAPARINGAEQRANELTPLQLELGKYTSIHIGFCIIKITAQR